MPLVDFNCLMNHYPCAIKDFLKSIIEFAKSMVFHMQYDQIPLILHNRQSLCIMSHWLCKMNDYPNTTQHIWNDFRDKTSDQNSWYCFLLTSIFIAATSQMHFAISKSAVCSPLNCILQLLKFIVHSSILHLVFCQMPFWHHIATIMTWLVPFCTLELCDKVKSLQLSRCMIDYWS